MRYNALQWQHVTDRVKEHLKTVTANFISRRTIKRQSQNAQLQQHCCTTSHSSCSNCPPSAAAHARSMEKYVMYGEKTRAMSFTR